MSHIDLLKKILLEEFISFFSVGDSFTLNIGNYYLICQSIISIDEKLIDNCIIENYPLAKFSADKEYISKSTIIAANLRKKIIDVTIDNKCCLTLKFENGSDIFIPTNETIVDWQWAINENGGDPYRYKNTIACFWEGEITCE